MVKETYLLVLPVQTANFNFLPRVVRAVGGDIAAPADPTKLTHIICLEVSLRKTSPKHLVASLD